ncbi:thiamine pyrophosphate-dependent enzyme [Streptomyces sp. KL116D]|uniref:thiamine pyrophosphate-dependent enzyme n=1 Tax=Streptomyces sp. KL116D TaxID=3045152 RepID=UPI003556B4A9
MTGDSPCSWATLTLVQYDLPVKVIVFNNSSLGMVDLEMMVDGLPPHRTTYAHAPTTRPSPQRPVPAASGWRSADVRGALREAFAR